MKLSVFFIGTLLSALLAVGPVAAADCPPILGEMTKLMLSGGPGKDGIPSLDNPKLVPASQVKLADDALVFGVMRPGLVAAFPHIILVWHEIANLKVGGTRLSLTYCPLTRSAIGYEGHELGVSGKLLNSNLVMYDRATDSPIPQMLGVGVSGPLCGRELKSFPVEATTWGRWRKAHPQTLVLSNETGHRRSYGHDPYGDYYTNSQVMFPVVARSQALEPKEMVLGLEHNGEHLAVLKKGFDRRHPRGLLVELGGKAIKLTWDPVLAVITPDEPVKAFEAFWFAWFAFFPRTKLVK